MTVSWHVDDLIVSHIYPNAVDEFLMWIKETYRHRGEVKTTTEKCHAYLGMKLYYSQITSSINQDHMVDYHIPLIEVPRDTNFATIKEFPNKLQLIKSTLRPVFNLPHTEYRTEEIGEISNKRYIHRLQKKNLARYTQLYWPQGHASTSKHWAKNTK